MDSLQVRTYDLENAKREIQRFSQSEPKTVNVSRVRESGRLFGDHKVTGEELNGVTDGISNILVAYRSSLIEIYKEFKFVFNAIEALDRDYITGIVGAVNRAQTAIENNERTLCQVKSNQDNIRTTQSQLERTVDNLGRTQNELRNTQVGLKTTQDNLANTIRALQATVQKLTETKQTLENKIATLDNTLRGVQQFVRNIDSNNQQTKQAVQSTVQKLTETKQTLEIRVTTIDDTLKSMQQFVRNIDSDLLQTKQSLEIRATSQEQSLNILKQSLEDRISGFEHTLNEMKQYVSKIDRFDSKIDSVNNKYGIICSLEKDFNDKCIRVSNIHTKVLTCTIVSVFAVVTDIVLHIAGII